MSEVNIPYALGNTFTNIDDIQTVFTDMLLTGTEPSTNIDTTGNTVYVVLSEKTWKQGITNHIVIRNDHGASNYYIHLQATNSINASNQEKAKALQTSLNLTSVGSSVIIKIIRCGNGISPISINGQQVLSENTKFSMVLIQATNVTSGSETNDIIVLLNNSGQILKTLTISGNSSISYGGTVNLLGNPYGFNNTQTYQWYLNSQPISNATSVALTNFEITNSLISPLVFVLKATEDGIITTSNTKVVTINARNVSITGPSSCNYGDTVTFSINNISGFSNTPTYQWYLNSQPISNATSSSLNYMIPNDSSSPLQFVAYATDAGVITSSNTVTTTVTERELIITRDHTTRSIPTSANVGESIVLHAISKGFSNINNYIWYINSAQLTEKSDTLIYTVTQNDMNTTLSFMVQVTDSELITTGIFDVFIHLRKITISSTLRDDTVIVSIDELDGFSGSPTYKWYIDGMLDSTFQNQTMIKYPYMNTPLTFRVCATQYGIHTFSKLLNI